MFKTDNSFFDELAKAATGAVGAMANFRSQIQSEIKTQLNRFLGEMDLVTRDEYEIVEEMARAARLENTKLAARIAELEKKAGIKSAPVKTTVKKSPVKKQAKKAATKKVTKKPVAKKKK